ncbi:MAG: FAD-binding oxidoreductase, partial [Deltaproteobacteria bacterium]
MLAARLGCELPEATTPPRLEEINLPRPRIEAPPKLGRILTDEPFERASHTYGKAFRDVVRALRRDFSAAPDLVALPKSAGDVAAVLDWCAAERVAAIPYGGGSSVVGGVEARNLEGYNGAVSIDLRHLDRIVDIDRVSRAALIEAGIYGPALEDALRPHSLTLRHFPQSFEFSTLGGWIATRAGGHYATLYTHIDDFVEALDVVTPAGHSKSLRVPGSGAGPSPDRLMIGSEGTLGIITRAWMRLQDRVRYRASAPVRFATFVAGARAVRELSQSALYPTNLRLLDPTEAMTAGAGDGSHAVLIVGFESARYRPDEAMERALACCRDLGGQVAEGAGRTKEAGEERGEDAATAWRRAFLGAPYLRDHLAVAGFISETFETAVTWDRFEAFDRAVRERVGEALARICGTGLLSCRFTHVYPDGPAPYYTVLAPARPGSQLEQWDEIKAAAGDAVIDAGGTITHHHAIGRDHRPWYDRQRPE